MAFGTGKTNFGNGLARHAPGKLREGALPSMSILHDAGIFMLAQGQMRGRQRCWA